MPPRYSYWTILAGGLPTSFRAADRDDLLPTLRRLQERHPDAEMKWFQRGKLWESPEAARSDSRKPNVPRDRDWRPGGEHRDPNEIFRKNKRERNQARRQQRFARKRGDSASERTTEGSNTQHSNPYTKSQPRTGRPRSRHSTPRAKSTGGRRR
jgi:hypothetical protein